MKPYRLILILLFLLPVCLAFSQDMRLVTGTMKDNSGEPLPGINVVIKGTVTGTITDIDGKYSIKAPLGSILVFSFVGFNTKEVVVTLKNSIATPDKENNLKSSFTPVANKEYPDNEKISGDEGTAVFTSKTPSYSVINPNYNWLNEHSIVVNKIDDIDIGSDKAKINLVKDEYYHLPHISFYSSVSSEKHTRLPKLQTQYAQGRPYNGISQWRGPETGEILSWGPNLNNLEYDGITYDFDNKGRLVPMGTGNGIQAKAYNPASAFRSGSAFTNILRIFLKTEKKEYSVLYTNKTHGGILPGYSSTGNNAEIKWKRKYGITKLSTQFNYDNVKSNYLDGSPAQALIISSILTTPPSFDITNGKTVKNAYNERSTFQLNNNTQRSYSPGTVNHPYLLLQNLLDKENQQLWNALINFEIVLKRDFIVFIDGRYQHQENFIRTGYRYLPSGIDMPVTTFRKETLTSNMSTAGLKWNRYFNSTDINSILKYDNYIVNSRLTRNDNWLLDDSHTDLRYSLSRVEHNINWNSNLTLSEWFLFKMSHNLSSNNRYRNNKMFYAPTLAFGLNVHEILTFYGVIERLKVKTNWGYNYSNIPVSYSYGKFNYQNINSGEFYNTSFSHEVLPDLALKPEKILKKNIGLEIGLFNNKISLDVDYYEHQTSDAIFPVLENNMPVFKNMATNRVRGLDAEIIFHQRLGYNHNAQFRLVFDHYKSKVLDLIDGYKEVPLGGFADVHTSLVKGYPAGVVVGTAWLRDNNGNMIIDEDGYPVVDDKLKVIANPDPDFNLGLETSLYFGSITAAFIIEYRHGGEVWNGTGNVLSYHGLSEKTVEGRKVLEYVFPGVKQDGTVNTTPVDFAHPAKPLEQNRWYRYGLTGVAEDAIEDASWFRIREVSLTYKLDKWQVKTEFTAFVRNPLLITKYSGVDPNVTLWEKSNTAGLDLFNMPSVSSLGVSIKISL